MGLGVAAVQNVLELWQQGFFENKKKIIEMGSQELHLKPHDFEEMIKIAGVANYEKKNFPNLDNWPEQPRCPSKYLYKMLGIDEYYSFDLNEEHNSISWDFNLPFEDTSQYSQFDIVTDHCACGHAFNIAESYRTIHKLCKPGGLIIVCLPLWKGNGYFLYDRYFIDGIAAANNYKILFNSYAINVTEKTEAGSDQQFHIPMKRELLNTIDISKIPWTGIYAVLQKQTEDDFQFPYQEKYLAEKLNIEGFNHLYTQDPFSYSYIPFSSIETEPGKKLFKELFKRIRKRLFRI